MSDDDRHRGYGIDETEDGETLAEATLLDDGTMHIDVVRLDRDPSAERFGDSTEGTSE